MGAATVREMNQMLPLSRRIRRPRLLRCPACRRVRIAGRRTFGRGLASAVDYGVSHMNQNRQQGQSGQSQMGGQPGQGQMLQGWTQMRSRVQQQWSKLTDADLQQI